MKSKKCSLVFFIGNMSHSGGTERVLSLVANGLARRGYQITVISLWGLGQTFFVLDRSIKVFWLEKKCRGFNVLGQLRLLSFILNKERADYLIDVDIILGYYSFFLKRWRPELKWISWEHFNYFYHFPRNRCLRKTVRRLVCRFSDMLVVLTEEDREYYCRGLKIRCPVVQIYNPVVCRTDTVKGQERPLILAAGRLTRVKGFDLLIESWEMLESRYPDWQILIAGEGEERSELEKKIKTAGLKNIYLTGSTASIENLYRKTAFFVFPSRDEGFPMVLIEAMSFSLPVVSYSCRTGPKEIIADGEDGFLIEPGHTAEFAEKMELLMKDESLRRRMGRNAAESVRRFEVERILDQWEACLNSLDNAQVR